MVVGLFRRGRIGSLRLSNVSQKKTTICGIVGNGKRCVSFIVFITIIKVSSRLLNELTTLCVFLLLHKRKQ